MNRAAFRSQLRFLFSDLDTSNIVQRERLGDRPGNKFDGQNKFYFLFNRRICGIDQIYDSGNNVYDPANYAVTSGTGLISMTAMTDPNTFCDYRWQKLADAEMDAAIDTAAAPAGYSIDPTTREIDIPDNLVDFSAAYALAFCYLSAASRAAEYYTLAASGRQISKSELFNHYNSMYNKCLADAQSLRKDKFTDRGNRDTPADATSTSGWAKPYAADE